MTVSVERAPLRESRPSGVLWLFAAIGSLVALMAPNPFLALAGIVTLTLSIWLLWRPGEAPILLFVFGYQWLQVNAKTAHGFLLGLRVEDLNKFGGDVALAILLGNLGLLALAAGLRWGAGRFNGAGVDAARRQVSQIPIHVWLQIYALGWAVSVVAMSGAWLVAGLTQPLLALASFRWAGFFMLTYAAFARRRHWKLWWLVFGAEFLLSVGGFFSGFQSVIFYAMFGLVAALVPLTLRRLGPLLLLASLLVVSALVWTAVKTEYRGFVSGGTQAQIVVVERSERLTRLGDMVTNLESGALIGTLDTLAERVAYVDFFARVIQVVPEAIPHEQGALWGDALSRVFMPRLLFPDKPAVHDSLRTNYYTGLGVATHAQGTSISLGYLAESYIDFGVPLMFLPVLILGYAMGRFYRWLHTSPRTVGIWGMALAVVALWPAMAFETSITKMLVALAMNMLMAWALARFALPVLIPWLMGRYLRRRGLRSSLGTNVGVGG